MLTLKNLKNLVELPLHREHHVPTVKALEESGISVVAEKTMENNGSIAVYQNGYVVYRAHKRVTVFLSVTVYIINMRRWRDWDTT